MTAKTGRVPGGASGSAPPSMRRARRSEALAGYAMIAVPMLLFLVLQIGTVFYALYISLWRLEHPLRARSSSEGLANYTNALLRPDLPAGDPELALLRGRVGPADDGDRAVPGDHRQPEDPRQDVLPGAYYFPAIASSAAITILWIFIVSPSGLFNSVREVLPFEPARSTLFGYGPNKNWIGDQDTALNSVIILNAWTTSGTFMLFYLASLQSISGQVYEAAAIDGANAWQTFRHITFPLLRPGHYFVATVAVIGALQLFDQAAIAGGPNGDPNNALMTIVLYLYNAAFAQLRTSATRRPSASSCSSSSSASTLIQRRLFGEAPSW